MTRPARARFSALALVLSTVIMGAGCSSSEPEPTSQPAASPTPAPSSPTESTSPTESATPSESEMATASPSPTLTPPTMPPEAEALDSSGASAFFTYWWEEYNYARATGDTTRLEGLSAEECAFCASVVSTVQGLHSTGGHNEGGLVTVMDASAPPGEVDQQGYFVTAVVNQAEGRRVDHRGEVTATVNSEEEVRADAAVVLRDGKWMIAGVSLQRRGESG